ncbi:hypothetical protein N2152v2_001752 [Parachlorella kessleri]
MDLATSPAETSAPPEEFADSKTLTEEKRERLYEQIQQDPGLGYLADVLSAELISAKMLSREKVSLNQLANESTFKLIETVLEQGVNLQEVYVDTVGDAAKYQDKLSQRFPGLAFTVCPKADALYPIVSAASIVAKVTRDHLLRDFQHPESAAIVPRYGSGYPADPDTKAWLDSHCDPVFGFPSLVRFSWSTCTPILEGRAVKVRWECEEEGGGSQQTLCFATSSTQQPLHSQGTGRHSFFRARKLQRIHAGF